MLSLSDGGGVDCELSEEDSTGGIDSSVELLDSTISELLSGVDSGSEEELIVDLVLEQLLVSPFDEKLIADPGQICGHFPVAVLNRG